MADPKNDIITTVEATESDVADLKKAHYAAGGNTRQAAPVAQQPQGLNPQLVNMLTLGKTYYNFQGLDRCIRILDPNTPSQRHCGAMMVRNSSTGQFMCSNCDKVKDPNARPKIINSSMIKLPNEDLKELGLTEDPLYNKNAVVPEPEPIKKAKRLKKSEAEAKPRRVKMPVPNKVTIEVTMDELKSDPNVLDVLLKKTLEAIFELPVKNFREAEEIRVVKERVEEFLNREEGR